VTESALLGVDSQASVMQRLDDSSSAEGSVHPFLIPFNDPFNINTASPMLVVFKVDR
jgi:hypothetical protein